MTPKTMDQILQIFERIRCGEKTRSVWNTYEQSYIALYAWMDTLSEEDWMRIDDTFQNLFDVHLAMMELALLQ